MTARGPNGLRGVAVLLPLDAAPKEERGLSVRLQKTGVLNAQEMAQNSNLATALVSHVQIQFFIGGNKTCSAREGFVGSSHSRDNIPSGGGTCRSNPSLLPHLDKKLNLFCHYVSPKYRHIATFTPTQVLGIKLNFTLFQSFLSAAGY